MNKHELKAQMARHGDTSRELAKAIGISSSSLSCKMNGKRDQKFSQPEMQKIIDRYELTADDVMIIFFASDVSKMETTG